MIAYLIWVGKVDVGSITPVYCVQVNLSINILHWRTPAFGKNRIDRGEDGNAFEERVVE